MFEKQTDFAPQMLDPARGETSAQPCELTILMPCLNEAETLAACVIQAREFLSSSGIVGEVLIADNGSTDGSRDIARANGARVAEISQRGYGSALIGGIEAARGTYIVMGDADGSYDFGNLMPFIARLREGADLVMGNRFRGGIAKNAMPPLHRYLGNPVLSLIGRVFYPSEIKDFHCGLRSFRRDAILGLDLQTPGMEFASEMVVKATIRKLAIAEVPTTLSPDGRSRPPHLRSWHDGWRHLRFLLVYSPQWLFLNPGVVLMTLGFAGMVVLLRGPLRLGAINFDINTLLFSSLSFLLGLQAALFAVSAKVFAVTTRLIPPGRISEYVINRFNLETSLWVGAGLTVTGILGSIYAVLFWGNKAFNKLNPDAIFRITIPSATVVAAGIQILFASFFLSVLLLKRTPRAD